MMYENGEATQKDEAHAAALYQKACDMGAANACTSWGVFLEHGRGVTKDVPRAIQLYRRGCADGDAAGCDDLGAAFAKGVGVPRADLGQAAAFYDQACQKGLMEACVAGSGVLQTLHDTCEEAAEGGKKKPSKPVKLDAAGWATLARIVARRGPRRAAALTPRAGAPRGRHGRPRR
jgi:TPR repeat protein